MSESDQGRLAGTPEPPAGSGASARAEHAASTSAPQAASDPQVPARADPAAPAPPAPAAGLVDELAGTVARLVDEVGRVGKRVEELARLDARREELIDRLHADNQRLRAGEVAQAIAPVLRELMRSYDLVVSLQGGEAGQGSELALVRRRLLDGLEQFGVRPVDCQPGSEFQSSRHSAVQMLETTDAELDMRIARALRDGFVQDGERVLRPADVVVYRYAPDQHRLAEPPAADVAATTTDQE